MRDSVPWRSLRHTTWPMPQPRICRAAQARDGSCRGPAEAHLRALSRTLGFDLARARRRMRHEAADQRARRGGDVLHRALEGLAVGLRRHVEAAQLAHELQRRVTDLELRGWRLEVEQGSDVAAHGGSRCSAGRGAPRLSAASGRTAGWMAGLTGSHGE